MKYLLTGTFLDPHRWQICSATKLASVAERRHELQIRHLQQRKVVTFDVFISWWRVECRRIPTYLHVFSHFRDQLSVLLKAIVMRLKLETITPAGWVCDRFEHPHGQQLGSRRTVGSVKLDSGGVCTKRGSGGYQGRLWIVVIKSPMILGGREGSREGATVIGKSIRRLRVTPDPFLDRSQCQSSHTIIIVEYPILDNGMITILDLYHPQRVKRIRIYISSCHPWHKLYRRFP